MQIEERLKKMSVKKLKDLVDKQLEKGAEIDRKIRELKNDRITSKVIYGLANRELKNKLNKED